MKRHTHDATIAILAAFTLLVSAGCTLSAEADVEDVEITWRNLRFAGLPEALPSGPYAVAGSFELDSSNLSWAKQLNAAVFVTKVRLRAVDGVENLDFVKLASASISDAANSQASLPVMCFELPAAAASGPELVMENSPPVDATLVWSGARVRVDVALAGILPRQAWAIDVSLHLDGEMALSP
jgi:hypothetical protein